MKRSKCKPEVKSKLLGLINETIMQKSWPHRTIPTSNISPPYPVITTSQLTELLQLP